MCDNKTEVYITTYLQNIWSLL